MSKVSNLNDPIFYVYVYLDPRKPGKYVYGEYSFDYEPFYVGKGYGKRAYKHLIGNIYNKFFTNKIKKIRKICCCDPHIIKYKEMLLESVSFDLEIDMIETIGRKDLKLGPLCNLTNGGEGSSGYLCSDKTRLKMSLSKIGRTRRKESNEKQSKNMIGKNIGKHHTEESKKKISISKMGHKVTNDTKKKIGKSNTKYQSTIKKMAVELRVEGKTCKEIASILKIPSSTTIVNWTKSLKKLGGNRKYDDQTISKIIQMKENNLTWSEIVKETKIPKGTCTKWWYKRKNICWHG